MKRLFSAFLLLLALGCPGAQQTINLGTAPTGVGGDSVRTGFQKTNENFTELYAASGAASDGDIIALAALSGTNNIYYRSAANTWSSVTIGSGLTFSGGTLTVGDLSGTYQTLDSDLTALAALSGTSTIYYRSAANTWSAVTIGSNLSFSGGTLGISLTAPPAIGSVTPNTGAFTTLSANTPSAGTNTTQVATTAYVQGERGPVTKTIIGDYTVGSADPRELKGGVIYVAAAATVTLPVVAAGYSVTIITFGDVAVSVDPNAADNITLDTAEGTLSNGDKITNSSTHGDTVVMTYLGGGFWFATTDGNWLDGN